MLVLNDFKKPPLCGKGAVGIVNFKRIAIGFEALIGLHKLFCRIALQKRNGAAVERFACNVAFRVEKLFILRIRQVQFEIHQLIFDHNGRNAICLICRKPGRDVNFLSGFRRDIGIKHRFFRHEVFCVTICLCAVHKLHAAEFALCAEVVCGFFI